MLWWTILNLSRVRSKLCPVQLVWPAVLPCILAVCVDISNTWMDLQVIKCYMIIIRVEKLMWNKECEVLLLCLTVAACWLVEHHAAVSVCLGWQQFRSDLNQVLSLWDRVLLSLGPFLNIWSYNKKLCTVDVDRFSTGPFLTGAKIWALRTSRSYHRQWNANDPLLHFCYTLKLGAEQYSQKLHLQFDCECFTQRLSERLVTHFHILWITPHISTHDLQPIPEWPCKHLWK